jgi:hypothetical protein
MRAPLASSHRQRRGIRRPKLGDLICECHDDFDLHGGALTHDIGDLPQTFDNKLMIAFGTQISAPGKSRVPVCETRPRPG